jgi:antitoxin component YwqK of YwqJK toxin-antitoxin module
MKFLKLLIKIAIGIIGLALIFIIVLYSGENYKTITKKTGNQTIKIETKKFFWKKISECTINSNGFYNGPSKSWYIFTGQLKSEGNYSNGYWQGRWNDYDRNGKLIMLREYNMGVPIKVFLPAEENFKELPKDEWPKYLDFKQSKPQRIHK